MNRAQKTEFVQSLRSTLQECPLIVVADYKGTTANMVNHFRRRLDEFQFTMTIVKNTLARRAVEGTELEGLNEFFNGMTAVVLSGDDPIAGAKALRDALKETGTIKVRGGFFEGDVLDAVGVKAIADLPSREELLVTLLRTVQEPPRQLLGVLQAPARDLLYLLKNFEDKLAEAEGE